MTHTKNKSSVDQLQLQSAISGSVMIMMMCCCLPVHKRKKPNISMQIVISQQSRVCCNGTFIFKIFEISLYLCKHAESLEQPLLFFSHFTMQQ